MFDLSRDPLFHFESLFKQACEKKVIEPNAMTLATVSLEGQPSARVVYYKGMTRGGLTFYTNYNGHKALDIENNPKICVNFYWAEIWQQIRIDGIVEKTTRSESEAYFKTRDRLSQIGAWASNQSEPIPNYEFFKTKMTDFEKKFANQEVPCPPNWGGYRIEPIKFEFWFGQAGRLHERYIHTKKSWTMLSP